MCEMLAAGLQNRPQSQEARYKNPAWDIPTRYSPQTWKWRNGLVSVTPTLCVLGALEESSMTSLCQVRNQLHYAATSQSPDVQAHFYTASCGDRLARAQTRSRSKHVQE